MFDEFFASDSHHWQPNGWQQPLRAGQAANHLGAQIAHTML